MRREFPKRVRLAAAERARGRCERHLWREGEACLGRPVAFDHVQADGLGGEPTLENCAALCASCHKEKTQSEDNPRMRKADAQRRHVLFGLRGQSRPIQSRGFPKVEKIREGLKRPLPPRREDWP